MITFHQKLPTQTFRKPCFCTQSANTSYTKSPRSKIFGGCAASAAGFFICCGKMENLVFYISVLARSPEHRFGGSCSLLSAGSRNWIRTAYAYSLPVTIPFRTSCGMYLRIRWTSGVITCCLALGTNACNEQFQAPAARSSFHFAHTDGSKFLVQQHM